MCQDGIIQHYSYAHPRRMLCCALYLEEVCEMLVLLHAPLWEACWRAVCREGAPRQRQPPQSWPSPWPSPVQPRHAQRAPPAWTPPAPAAPPAGPAEPKRASPAAPRPRCPPSPPESPAALRRYQTCTSRGTVTQRKEAVHVERCRPAGLGSVTVGAAASVRSFSDIGTQRERGAGMWL